MSARKQILSYWTAAVTRQHQEQRAAHHIEIQGFKYYLPLMLQRGRRTVPLFPGYIFVKVQSGWRSLLGTKGISRLFIVDEKPTRIPDRELRVLRDLENERGLVVFPPRLTPGQTVRVDDENSAWDGRLGEICSMDATGRCRVLLSILGRRVARTFEERSLEAA
jgi:transcription antitermination factor NusG